MHFLEGNLSNIPFRDADRQMREFSLQGDRVVMHLNRLVPTDGRSVRDSVDRSFKKVYLQEVRGKGIRMPIDEYLAELVERQALVVDEQHEHFSPLQDATVTTFVSKGTETPIAIRRVDQILDSQKSGIVFNAGFLREQGVRIGTRRKIGRLKLPFRASKPMPVK